MISKELLKKIKKVYKKRGTELVIKVNEKLTSTKCINKN